MKRLYEKYWLPILIILLTFWVSLFVVNSGEIRTSTFTNENFLFTYLSIFLGISITILTFIASMIDKIKSRLKANDSYSKSEKDQIENSINATYHEIKENILFLFISFLVVVFIIAFNKFDFPLIELTGDFFNKVKIFNAIKLSIFILSLYAIYDLIMISFRISDATGEIQDN